MVERGHYPGYDVMREEKAWDDHTREIVRQRVEPQPPLSLLGAGEAALLGAAAGTLLDETDRDILDFAISEIDRSLAGGIGESQREVTAPPIAELIRRGLAALDASARADYGDEFGRLPLVHRQELLGRVERGELPGNGPWQGLPQKTFFRKLLSLAVAAYYSHPAVWSAIGYGGPAYPRGYVRYGPGQLDPWEARRAKDADE